MQSLKFRQLLVLSNSQKSANRFEFSKTLNLVTAKDNSVGKSTLVKLIFWGLGCEPSFDTILKSLDFQTIVEFEIGENIYRIKRYKTSISLKENDESYIDYEKITGAFSEKMSEIFRFKALLNNRADKLETPPPAFYFLPFYIDQQRSWGKSWDNFENLGQYASWKGNVIKYHVGLLSPEHFNLESSKYEKKEKQIEHKSQVDKNKTALEVVDDLIPRSTFVTLDSSKFEDITNEIKQDLSLFQKKQEQVIDMLAHCQSEKVYLEQQKIITESIIVELDKDYMFSVENMNNGEIECPLCGVVHDNSIINRASILTDKVQAENQLFTINKELSKICNRLDKLNIELKEVESNIALLNEKYIITDNEETFDTSQIIEMIAGNSIKQTIEMERNRNIVEIDKLTLEIKDIVKEQKLLITKDEIETINTDFIRTFKTYIDILEAEAINLSEINTPLDYTKIFKEGGAAEGSRAILAYYVAIFKMIEKHGNEVKSPLVIDTPNQHEQSDTNYSNIVKLIMNEIDENDQIILCAMQNEHLIDFQKKAKVFTFDKEKLFIERKYDKIKIEFDMN